MAGNKQPPAARWPEPQNASQKIPTICFCRFYVERITVHLTQEMSVYMREADAFTYVWGTGSSSVIS